MIRFLIFLLIAYLGYRALKNWIVHQPTNRSTGTIKSGRADAVDDIMVQDPVCQVYFPKRDGIVLQREGKDIYFCSETCKSKYLGLDRGPE